MLSLEINISSNQEKKTIIIIIISSITHLAPPARMGTAYIGGFLCGKAQPNWTSQQTEVQSSPYLGFCFLGNENYQSDFGDITLWCDTFRTARTTLQARLTQRLATGFLRRDRCGV